MKTINSIINNIDIAIKNKTLKDEFYSLLSVKFAEIYHLMNRTNNEVVSKIIAIKLINLLSLKYEFLCGHSYLKSKPFGLSAESSNACNLYCPGCIRDGKPNKIKEGLEWDKSFMNISKYSKLLENFGPYAMVMQLHNWGEPTLNKQLPAMIKMAKEYLLYVFFSTNLSTKFDAEELVLSGVDFITVAIDGASHETYSKYRRGGNFDIVIENLENLCSAKRKYKKNLPVISWQFLTFEHNKHELDIVIKLAEELGVNRIHVGTPYPMSDDPKIKPYKSERNGPLPINMQMKLIRNEMNDNFGKINIPRKIIDQTFSSVIDNYTENNYDNPEESHGVNNCKWLYMNMFMDAHGRILPCCIPPHSKTIFGEIGEEYSSSFNSEKYIAARKWLSSKETSYDNKDNLDFQCLDCSKKKSIPNMNLSVVRRLLNDYQIYQFLTEESVDALTSWSFS